MSDQRIWLVRHGQSEWNATRRWQGHADPPLTAEGLREAEERAPVIAEAVRRSGRPVRLFSSDLQRARQTAAPVAAILRQEVTALERLRELDVGTWSGLTRDEISARDPERLAAFEAGDEELRAGGAESRRELQQRVLAEALRLAGDHADSDLLLVVHRGVVRALAPGTQVANLELVETRTAAVDEIAKSPRG